MDAQGCGTIANKIFQKHAKTHLKYAIEEDLMSSDEDSTYKPNYEDAENEGESSFKGNATRKQPSSKRGCMSDFTQPSAIKKELQHQQQQLSKQQMQSPKQQQARPNVHQQQARYSVHQKQLQPCSNQQQRQSFEQQPQRQSMVQSQQQPVHTAYQGPKNVNDFPPSDTTVLSTKKLKGNSVVMQTQQPVQQSSEQQQRSSKQQQPVWQYSEQEQPVRQSSKLQKQPSVQQPQQPLVWCSTEQQQQQQPPSVQQPQHQPMQQPSSEQHLSLHQPPVQQQPSLQIEQRQALDKQLKNTKQRQQQFCAPGSLSSFLALRKQIFCPNKQVENIRIENDFQNTLTNGSELEERSIENEPATDTRELMEESQPTCVEALKNKKHRGPTKLTDVHARTIDERPAIILNPYGQPVGPSKKIVKEFSHFLGTVARNREFAPLNYCEWPSLPTHEKIWNYVLDKYMVPIEGKKWVMETTNESWCLHKSRMKKKHYYAYDTDALRWENRRKTMAESTFRQLLNYWDNEEIQVESERNRNNRLLLDDMHTMGPSSYAMLRQKLKEKDPNKEEPSKAKVYRTSRVRNPKRSYKTNFGVTKHNMEQMDAMESQEQGSKDPYHEVIKKPEHGGRVRLYGKGVTKSDLRKGGKRSAYIFSPEFLQSMQMQVLEQVLEANPEVKKLLEANPKVKIVVPDMSSAATDHRSRGSESYGQSSIGTHSPNEQAHVQPNGGMEVQEFVQPTE